MEPLSIKTYVFLVSGCVQGEEESLGFYRQFEKFSIIGKWRGIIGRIISAHAEVTGMIFRLLASFTHKGNVRCKRSVLSSCMGESLMFTGSGESAGALLWLLTKADTGRNRGQGCIPTRGTDPTRQSGTRQRPKVQAQECILHTGGTETPPLNDNPCHEERYCIAEFKSLSFPPTLRFHIQSGPSQLRHGVLTK